MNFIDEQRALLDEKIFKLKGALEERLPSPNNIEALMSHLSYLAEEIDSLIFDAATLNVKSTAQQAVAASASIPVEEVQVYEKADSAGFFLLLPDRSEWHFDEIGNVETFSKPVAA